MTSPILPVSAPQDLADRSVRDVVEYSPGEVNDAWCRNILRNILDALELQYATQMPHRAITPDTILLHANGKPLLILDDSDAVPAPDSQLADDLTALARVIHYAISQELAPAGPLAGRVDGYSAGLVATVDACMDPDPARRPRDVAAVRGLLGMHAPAPRLPASASPPVVTPVPVEPAIPGRLDGDTSAGIGATPDSSVKAHHAGMRRGQRWAIAGGGAIALALALALFPRLRDAGSPDATIRKPAQTVAEARQGLPAPRGPAAGDVAADPASDLAGSAGSGASSGGTTRAGGGEEQPGGMTGGAPDLAGAAGSVAATLPPAASTRAAEAAQAKRKAAANARALRLPNAVPGNASYQLHIKPWGLIYVDGVDRGVSPPLKRLALTPGRHTIRITHPDYRDSILEFDSAQTTSNGKIIVDFTQDAQ